MDTNIPEVELQLIEEILLLFLDVSLEFEGETEVEQIEFATYTNGGVNQIYYIDITDKDNIVNDVASFLLKFDDYFDINNEIDMYREMENYRREFSIQESVEDFQNFVRNMKYAGKMLLEIHWIVKNYE